ncbi:hypothetical protein R3W88_022579 [Solanum pinnatisectum]|uniref:Gag-pol polyprotein n=1 Tax=Solanum pinnatisectum TaxID=50273 RepID=A0AAV9LV50_9SOLN|nr:hypothetical protein R3W88_022579 [Solanum pinnatisectum]
MKPVIQKIAGILGLDVVTALTAYIAAMQNMMNIHFSNLALGQQPAQVNAIQQPPSWCEICGGSDHSTEVSGANPDSVNFVGNAQRGGGQQNYGNSYNPKLTQEGEFVAQEERLQPIVKPPPPFPQKIKKQKEDECFGKFLSLLKQVHINLPLVDVMQGIPRYAKYVKEIVVNKMRLTEYETVTLTEECSSRIQNNINLMLTFLYKKLALGSPKSTTIILQLADRSVARPKGVVEDVLVQVGSLIFNFVVLNFELDLEVPFILGRAFLATGWAMIDVAAGQLTMRAHDKVEVFDVYKALKLLAMYEELSAITVIDLEAEALYIASKDPLERVLVGDDIYEDADAQEIV